MDYSFRLTARVLLYAPHRVPHRQEDTRKDLTIVLQIKVVAVTFATIQIARPNRGVQSRGFHDRQRVRLVLRQTLVRALAARDQVVVGIGGVRIVALVDVLRHGAEHICARFEVDDEGREVR